ncbi:restriction endonuclease subunit S, partial [Candidatus Micrarchaeota archaeon CG11_big_fil_rev_8_21_14_0_20_47_5]
MKSQIYKDTELGRLPKEWEVAKFADNFEYAKGKKPNEVADERKSNFLPYLSTEYLRENILTKFADFSEGVEVVADGELILLWDGSNAGEIFYGKKGVLSSTMVKIKQKTDKFQTNFLFYLLKSKQDYLQSQTKGTGIPHVSGNVLDNLLLPLPPLSEQQKISEILSTVDSAIQKTDEILAKTERLKKGAMQKLLAKGIGHKEFKDTEIGRLPKEWEVVKLGKISELKNGINFSKIQKAEGGLPTIDVLNMYGNSIYADLSSLYSVQINLESNSDFVLKNGDILFVRSSMKREGAGWA